MGSRGGTKRPHPRPLMEKSRGPLPSPYYEEGPGWLRWCRCTTGEFRTKTLAQTIVICMLGSTMYVHTYPSILLLLLPLLEQVQALHHRCATDEVRAPRHPRLGNAVVRKRASPSRTEGPSLHRHSSTDLMRKISFACPENLTCAIPNLGRNRPRRA